jgi:hypothetical protein
MPHLRAAAFSELLKCEKLFLNATGEKIIFDEDDMVFYGQKEIEVCTGSFCLHLHPEIGGNASEISEFKTYHNVGFVMKRRPEIYHREIATTNIVEDESARSLHEIIKVKESDVEDKIFYDWYDRHSFIFHFFHPNTKLYDFSQARYGEQGDFVNQPYVSEIDKGNSRIIMKREGHVWSGDSFLPVSVLKIFEFSDGLLKFLWKIENISGEDILILPGIEFNLTASSEKSSAFIVGDKKYSTGEPFESSGSEIFFEEKLWNLKMKFRTSENMKIWIFPVNSVCRLEGVVESLFQGASLTFLKEEKLSRDQTAEGFIEVSVQ